ncbi:MAG: molybdopterin cofactor-binding domain-containing protein [Phycisphaerales bacterium]
MIPTPTTNRPINAGQSLADDIDRLDAVAKVTGRAKYSRDQYLANGLFACLIRCPIGAGTLESIDLDSARAVPGVVEVECEAGAAGQYHGHNVGVLVAESPLAMKRGMRALRPRWRRGAFTTTIDESNPTPEEPSEQTRSILDRGPRRLTATYTTEVQTHSPLETHGAVVDHRGDSATVYSSTQGTFAARDGLDEPLGLPRARYEVVCEYVGGGFGSKLNGPGKEGVTAARLSAKHRRPVYLFVNRGEDHLDTGNRPSSRTQVDIAFGEDGTIHGGQVSTWGGVGVSRGGGGVNIPSGRYSLGTIQKTHNDVQTNAGAPRPFRAPGHPQGAFAEEMVIEEVAGALNLDPLALRQRLETSDERRRMMDVGADLIGWRDRRRNGEQTGIVRRGFGMGVTSWPRFPAQAEGEVVINRDASIEVRTGTQDIGTGMRTVAAVVACHELGVPVDRCNVRIGSSNLPPGPGSGGSMTTPNTAPAIAAAARDAKRRFLEWVAQREGADASEFDIRGGEVLRHNEPYADMTTLTARLPDSITGRGESNRQTLQREQGSGHSDGVQFAEVSVDTQTGVVRVKRIVAIQSCGLVVARKLAESQIIGGVIQGVSYALFEHKVLDRNTGTMVNPNLEWYKVAGTDDMPHIEPVLWSDGQDSVRPLGEPPTIPTSGAIACAVLNAIGWPVRSLPLTPDRVLAALDARAAHERLERRGPVDGAVNGDADRGMPGGGR